jgi:PAS domain S-box-containing protein
MGVIEQRTGDRARADDARLPAAALDHLPALISYWDRDLRNHLANNAFVEWFGLTPARLRGIRLGKLLGEESFAVAEPHVAGVLAGDEQVFDRALVDRNGRTRHVQTSYVPDVVAGEVRGFFELVTDVTARVEAQRRLDDAQALACIGSWETVISTGEVRFSDELYRIFGHEPGAIEPSVDVLLAQVHPDDVARVVAARDRAVQQGTTYDIEYCIVRTDGSVREVQSRGRPVSDASGTVVRLTGTLQDVTELNQAARELTRTNAELLQLNELNADVLGMLGQDVRGPVSVVLGYLEELDEDWATSTDAVRQAHVATARAAAARLRTLVDDILALSSVDTGTVVAEVADHDLTMLVVEALSEVPGHADIRLEGERDLKVWCDAFHVRQIVSNLVSNALRYGAPPVVVSMIGGDDTAQVTVSDHGAGVPEEFVANLFERFGRGPGEHAPRGSGLGLYIAGRLAEANHGVLAYARGAEGEGATFTLTLPRFG